MSETATNVSLSFADVTLLREALLEWAAGRPSCSSIARIGEFTAFVIRHPELLATTGEQP